MLQVTVCSLFAGNREILFSRWGEIIVLCVEFLANNTFFIRFTHSKTLPINLLVNFYFVYIFYCSFCICFCDTIDPIHSFVCF